MTEPLTSPSTLPPLVEAMVIAELLPAVAPPVMVVPSRTRCSVAPLLPDLPQRSSSALTPTETLE